MPRALKRMVDAHDSMIRELAEIDPLFSDFKVVEVGEGVDRTLVLVSKTPEEKRQLAEALAKAEEITD
jgi:hypothetical protein